MDQNIAFIGAGAMTEAIVSGIVSKDILTKEQIIVTNKRNQARLDFLQETYNIQCVQDNGMAVRDADIIVLSMQPFDIKTAIDSIKSVVTSDQLIISVAAGISTDAIAEAFNLSLPVIRVNPNMPASIGLSATAISKGEHATDEHVAITEALFQTIGATAIIPEKDMHVVTGLSGSGPAYVYYVAEAMEAAAIQLGLDQESAKLLIAQTFLGAGEMLRHSGVSAKQLKENVISPGGTTEAGINTLKSNAFEQLIYECIRSARDRSIELGDE